MGVEIERKFLIKPELWAKVKPEASKIIRQAYLSDDPDKTIRVRTAGEEGFLTIKTRATGITRQEFEYSIPYGDATTLIDNLCTQVIEKVRHYVQYAGKLWEVDEFRGSNDGLMVAEIELDSEAEIFAKPDWLEQEVTDDIRYLNSSLAKHPYQQW